MEIKKHVGIEMDIMEISNEAYRAMKFCIKMTTRKWHDGRKRFSPAIYRGQAQAFETLYYMATDRMLADVDENYNKLVREYNEWKRDHRVVEKTV